VGRRKKIRIAIFGITALAFAICIFFRIHSPRDFEAFFEMAGESPPVWRQFAFRRFGAGDSVAELLRRYPPARREEFGRYGVYQYGGGFIGLGVTSRDGKILSAGAASCAWKFMFFQTEDPEIDSQYAAYLKEKRERFERQELMRLEGELRKFYSQQSRWPTNAQEFSEFVTGSPSLNTNDLWVTLVQQADGTMDIALINLPGEMRSVARPVW